MPTVENHKRADLPGLAAASFPPLIVAAALALIACLPGRAAAGPAMDAAATGATPLAYRIDLAIDPAKTSFGGHVEIDAIVHDTRTIRLDGRNLRVTKVIARLPTGSIPGTYRQVDGDGHARIDFARALPAGRVTIAIDYSADIHDEPPGLFHAQVGPNWYVGSALELTNARVAYPCFDLITWKTPFTVTLTVPKGLIAVSNMPEVSKTADGPYERHVFRQSPPLPTYLVSFAVGRFAVAGAMIPPDAFRPYPLPLRVLAPQGDQAELPYVVSETSKIVRRLESLVRLPFPYPKLDEIGSPVMKGGMENAGAALYGDDQLLMGEHASARDYAISAFVVAHELAHQWFGDFVTPRTWGDLWLKESFAQWAATLVADELEPNLGIVAFERLSTWEDMKLDSLPGAKPMDLRLDEANSQSGYGGSYGKGPQVLTMVEEYVGAKRFREAVHEYLVSHANGSAGAEDLLAALARSTDDPAIVEAMRTFLDNPGLPVLDLQRTGRTLAVNQHRYAPLGLSLQPQTWIIPFCFRQSGAKHCVLIDREHAVIHLERSSPIIPDADGAGYYRFDLTAEGWAALTARAAQLRVSEQLALNDSLWAAFAAGQLEPARLLDATRELSVREQPDVTLYLAKHWMDLRARGTVPDIASAAYGRFLRTTYGPLLARLGSGPRGGRPLHEDSPRGLLRSELVRALAIGGADPALDQALDGEVRRFLAGDEQALDPAYTLTGFEVYLRRGGPAAGEALLRKALASHDGDLRSRILEALGASDSARVGEWLITVLDRTGLRPTEKSDLIQDLLSYSHTTDPALAWLSSHYARLIASGGRGHWGPGIAMGACSRTAATQIVSIMGASARPGTAAGSELDDTLEAIHTCAAFREAEADEIGRALDHSD